MLEFMRENAPIVSAAAGVGTLAIWTIYLHIFVAGHQRQLKPMLIINRAEGRNLDARCFVTNMSRDPVHIQSVVAKLITDEDKYITYITDAEDIRNAGNPSGWEHMTRQGPLASGMMVDMGSYRCILDYAAQSCCGEDKFHDSQLAARSKAVEIMILGIYGSEDMLIGASRLFEIDRSEDEIELRPTETQTRQISRWSDRKALAQRLAEEL